MYLASFVLRSLDQYWLTVLRDHWLGFVLYHGLFQLQLFSERKIIYPRRTVMMINTKMVRPSIAKFLLLYDHPPKEYLPSVVFPAST